MSINLRDIDPDTLYTPREASVLIKSAEGTLANRRVAGLSPKFVKAGNSIGYTGKSLKEHLLGVS